MGKKKKKNRKKNSIYNKAQFIDVVCSQCKLCYPDPKPSFCYSAYVDDPDTFFAEVYGNLLKLALWVDSQSVNNDLISMLSFREVFCYSGICGSIGYRNTCEASFDCYNAFKNQIEGTAYNSGKKKKDKHHNKKQEVGLPYSTFFISDNPEFRKTVEGILGNGNRNIEFNSATVSTTSDSG